MGIIFIIECTSFQVHMNTTGNHFFIGNGYITTSTLKEILKELDDKLTSDELDMMIAEIDSDGSGTVDFDGRLVNLRHSKYLTKH